MIRTALRVAALFAGYSMIGLGGDYAVGLLGRDHTDSAVQPREAPRTARDVTPTVIVAVKPTIVARVRIRHGGACDFQLDREFTMSAAGVTLLNIDAGAGELHVEGRDGLDEIIIVGRVCASDEGYLDDLRLSVEESANGEVTLVTHYPEQRDRSGRNATARIDLTVLMPRGLNVDIEDSSGEMDVFGTGDLKIDDSSGSIRVAGVDGSLIIDDSSGSLDVQDIAGDVSIEDGSGGISIRDIRGSLRLRDGSGGIDIAAVDQDVIIESDGSGGIEVRDVGGDFIVERDGSGGIRHSGVRGLVDVPVRGRRRGGD